ncbi:MAG: DUF3307 domain-containing protein [Clostridiaceae bacterium]
MFREYFLLLLLGHVLGDFYLQTKGMAEKKEKSIKWVLLHSLCYLGTMILIGLPIISLEIVLVIILASILHLVIDTFKYIYFSVMTKKRKKTQVIERNIFFVDQLLHLVFLIFIAYGIVINDVVIREWKVVEDFFSIVGISEVQILSWILALLIIHKPANIAIQKLLLVYKPKNKDVDVKMDNNAGRFIGTIERIIMLIFLAIGQYSAIGLVLTAKSIARYDRISKEKDFAEYYLLGTLISTVVVIVVSFIV